MATELALYDPDPALSLRKTKVLLEHLQSIIDTFPVPSGESADWQPTRLALGSLALAVRPSSSRESNVPEELVAGLRVLADDATLPVGWPVARARAVRRLVRAASLNSRVEVVVDGRPEQAVFVDDALITGVDRALRVMHTSFGSVVGHLRELADRQKLTAILVLASGDEVAVEFSEDQDVELRSAWRERRVEVTGYLDERADGTPTRVRMRSLEVLGAESALSSGDLQGGFYPNITDGLSVDEYLARMRGSA